MRLDECSGLTKLTATTTCQDPHAAYARLRARWGEVAPVELEPGISAWLVMGYRELCAVTRTERLFSRDPHTWRLYAQGQVRPDSELGPMMFPRDNAYFSDGLVHRRRRAPLDDGLDGLDAHQLDTFVRRVCRDRIEAITRDRDSIDLVADYAAFLPLQVVPGLFGLDPAQADQIRSYLIALFSSGAGSQAGNSQLEQLLGEMVTRRRACPVEDATDLTSAFLRHPGLQTQEEIVQQMVLMISAGTETTTSWISNTLRLMLTDDRFSVDLHSGQLGVGDALEELLWHHPPMMNMPARYALQDTDLAGAHIRRGDALILGLAAANSAMSRVPDPWDLVGNQAHLAFSAGPHRCPAERLARLVVRRAVETVLTLMPGLRLTIPAADIPWLPSPWTRCPAALPVAVTAPSRRPA